MGPGLRAPPSRTPVVAFTVSPEVQCRAEQIRFDASISSDDVGIAEYAWSFAGRGVVEEVTAHHVFGLGGNAPP